MIFDFKSLNKLFVKLNIVFSKKLPNLDFILLLKIINLINLNNFIKKSQWWSKEKIYTYQSKKLHELIVNSYENVPYYRKIFDKKNIDPNSIKTVDDIKKLPFLTKDIIRKNINQLKSTDYPEYIFQYTSTSGSTGKPLNLYVNRLNHPVNSIVFHMLNLKRAGCSFFEKSVDLRGIVNISNSDNKKFWKYSLFHRRLSLSPFYLTEEYIPCYIKKMREFNPKYIEAFPSTIIKIARYMKKNNLKPLKNLKVIFSTGEFLYDWQYKLLEEVFKCRIFLTYGHSENTAVGGSCEKSNLYHFFPEYGIVELIGKNEELIREDGKKGEIVTTGFMNKLFPLIRYRTGDFGIYKKKCECGRNCFLLKEIQGKCKKKYIYTKDNRKIPFTSINIDFKIFNNVERFQFYQNKKGVLVLRLIKTKKYSNDDAKKIKKQLNSIFKNDIDLKIELVDNISGIKSGKFSYLVQDL